MSKELKDEYISILAEVRNTINRIHNYSKNDRDKKNRELTWLRDWITEKIEKFKIKYDGNDPAG